MYSIYNRLKGNIFIVLIFTFIVYCIFFLCYPLLLLISIIESIKNYYFE